MKAVFFDLDGTLMPMDQEVFLRTYLAALGKFITPKYDAKLVVQGIIRGVELMMKNTDPTKTCEQVFGEDFSAFTGLDWPATRDELVAFYGEPFASLGVHFPPNPLAPLAVQTAHENGRLCILSTNPIFPAQATYARIKWAGLEQGRFAHVTTYEGCSFCKPNPQFFRWLMETYDLAPDDCAVVGNDEREDIRCAHAAGIKKTFLLTNDAIFREGDGPTQASASGDFEVLIAWLKGIG